MIKNSNKRIYEFIMRDVAKIVKKHLNENEDIIDSIPTKFNKLDYLMSITINTIQKYAQQLKVRPIILTNYQYDYVLYSFRNIVYIYFKNNWFKDFQNTYLCLYIDKNNIFHADIIIRDYGLTVSPKKTWEYTSENLEECCKKLLEYLDENPEFYNEVKK